MLFVLGIGSLVALTNAIITMIWDEFPKIKYWYVALFACIMGYFSGLLYVTPVRNQIDIYLNSVLTSDSFFPGRTVDAEPGRPLWRYFPDICSGHW